jgi:hypothetical protein
MAFSDWGTQDAFRSLPARIRLEAGSRTFDRSIERTRTSHCLLALTVMQSGMIRSPSKRRVGVAATPLAVPEAEHHRGGIQQALQYANGPVDARTTFLEWLHRSLADEHPKRRSYRSPKNAFLFSLPGRREPSEAISRQFLPGMRAGGLYMWAKRESKGERGLFGCEAR